MSQNTSYPKASAAKRSNSPSSVPRVLSVEDLSPILKLAPTSIRHYTGNSETLGHLLPKWFKLPGGRRLLWLEEDVLAFIQSGIDATIPEKPRKRGRPTKAEQVRNAALVFTRTKN
ncbi:helix-turn-helix transcriptional regulator [Herminiimonas contaminans]|uniref:AlpA family transcriptional regulator n=1 Tax=Herminiimonas contaminans TaxID=1111140 RepID=A0ABS0EUV6_9BURK|nr:hypothetical protein [Herminiimonas contaminans]MBF8177617.1 hypothetical protein [Herminiimonas contaminans]